MRHRLDRQQDRRCGPRVDLAGRRFGRLVVRAPTEARAPHGQLLWRCRGDCGAEALADTSTLRSGAKTCCGWACTLRPSRQRAAAARRMQREGKTYTAIAAELGVSPQRVYQLLAEHAARRRGVQEDRAFGERGAGAADPAGDRDRV